MKRTTGTCKKCGEEGDIAAHGLCYACYRQKQRDAETQRKVLPGISRKQKRLLSAYNRALLALADLGLSREEILRAKKILNPHLRTVTEYLNASDEGSGKEALADSET